MPGKDDPNKNDNKDDKNTDPNKKGVDNKVNNDSGGSGDDGKNGDDKGKTVNIPQSVWDQNYARMKKAEEENTKLKKEHEEAENKKLQENKQYQELADKYKTENEELKKQTENKKSLEETLENILTETMKSIPEEKQKLVPINFTVKEKLDYITANKSFLTVSNNTTGENLPKNNKDAAITDLDKMKNSYDELMKVRKEKGYLDFKQQKELTELSRKIVAADNQS